MSEVIQIICPKCKKELRVPMTWTEQLLRCKFCRQVLKPRKKHSAEPPPFAQPPPPASPRGQRNRRAGQIPVAEPAVAATVLSPRRSTGTLSLAGLAVAGAIFIVIGAAVIWGGLVFGPTLAKTFLPDGWSLQADARAKNDAQAPDVPVATPPAITVNPDQKAEAVLPQEFPDVDKPQPDVSQKLPDNQLQPLELPKAPDTNQKPVESNKNPANPKVPPAKDPRPPGKQQKPLEPANKGGPTVLNHIIAELREIPPTTAAGDVLLFTGANLPAIPADVLDAYKADYQSIRDFKEKEAAFPLRAAVARAILALRENSNIKMQTSIPSNLADKKLLAFKNQVKNQQDMVAQRTLVLKELVKELAEVGEKHREVETKRAQVLYDYVLLRLKARVVHVYEYNYNLALIRSDTLPKLENGNTGYRLTSQEKVIINEPLFKQYVKDLKKGWPELAKNHPDTPWAHFAAREQTVLLGLSWQPTKQ